MTGPVRRRTTADLVKGVDVSLRRRQDFANDNLNPLPPPPNSCHCPARCVLSAAPRARPVGVSARRGGLRPVLPACVGSPLPAMPPRTPCLPGHLAPVRPRQPTGPVRRGAGTGGLSRELAQALPEFQTILVDLSPAMLAEAAGHFLTEQQIPFHDCDQSSRSTFAGGAVSVVSLGTCCTVGAQPKAQLSNPDRLGSAARNSSESVSPISRVRQFRRRGCGRVRSGRSEPRPEVEQDRAGGR